MPTMPAKGLDRFVDTLTWKKALRDAEREHRARYEGRNAKRRAKGEEVLPYQALKPTRQVSYLHYLERGLSLMLVVSYGGTKIGAHSPIGTANRTTGNSAPIRK